MTKSMTYRDAGVDVKKIRAAQKSVGEIISATHKFPREARVVSGFGHYAGLIKLGSTTIALHSDGVGTKVLVAQLMNRFDTVGIDCVAMNVNDIVCVGAKPVGFIDYVALRQPNDWLLQEIAKGLVEGARQSQMAIVGGETAVLPDIIAGNEENAFDLAGMVMGEVVGKPILGHAIRPGNVILGVESSGLHSNGYTLARKVLLSRYSVDDNADYLVQTVGEEMLVPTRIYVRPVMEILKKKLDVHGLAHITGGSFRKLPRLNANVTYELEELPAPTGIFKQIQTDGGIDIKEMYRTFNMGIGLCIICPKSSADGIVRIFKKYGMHCSSVGRIGRGKGVVVARIGEKRQVL
ncbi:MAG TPA: phosphoribosylformylglycinamidine cyclo-ligase [Nitrososphaera sp.]|nr:phosphoribosylformylglycinamidine cyclo-ligase [Nitrososphaera sp.]